MALKEDFESSGNWLFRWRSYLPILVIGIVETDDVTGPLAGGGTFDITTDPGMEIIPSILAGLRFSLGETVFAEVNAHADYRFTSWDVKDRTSGATGSLDDYFTYGLYLGIGLRF